MRIAALLLFVFTLPAQAQSMLLVVSLDGMRPDYVLKADEHGLKIPHLRRLLAEGAHASGVRGVLPTVTYPSHTTILTGVWPAKHGIYSNVVTDPLGRNLDGWYWYAEVIRAPTLWDAASSAGMKVGSVSHPRILARAEGSGRYQTDAGHLHAGINRRNSETSGLICYGS